MLEIEFQLVHRSWGPLPVELAFTRSQSEAGPVRPTISIGRHINPTNSSCGTSRACSGGASDNRCMCEAETVSKVRIVISEKTMDPEIGAKREIAWQFPLRMTPYFPRAARFRTIVARLPAHFKMLTR